MGLVKPLYGIDFQDARDIFNSPLLEWEQPNAFTEHGEIRFNAIGLMHSYEVFAVYTERENGQSFDLFQYVRRIKMNAKTTTDTQTDWAKLARRDDSEIDYSDAPSIMPSVQQMRIRQSNGQVLPVSNAVVEVDADILAWFKTHQTNYQATINQLLRNFMKEHEHDLA